MRQPVTVEARFDQEGRILPLAFHWDDRRYLIQDHGRQWEADGERRFLVRVGGEGTFELGYDPATGRWSLIRGPEHFGPKRGRRS